MVLKIVWGFAIVLVLCAIYVRIAPTDIEKWHRKVDDPRDKSFQAGVIRVLPGAADQFNELQQIALSTPRTKVFAGSVESGMVTFVTRSRFWGFPDYATVWSAGDDLVIYSRLRFGNGDSGVNKAKVEKWISVLSSP